MQPNFEKIKQQSKELKSEIKEKTVGYIAAALGLVAGLAWNEAIKSMIDYFFPASAASALWTKLFYAVLVTVIVVIITVYLMKWSTRKKNE